MNNVLSVEEIFSGRAFRVPDYQRGYAWEEQQWEEFLEDLEYLSPGKDHYTGTVVLHDQSKNLRDEEGKTHSLFDVVDGQQRLTTVVILLSCISSEFEKSNKTLASGVRKTYVCFQGLNHQPTYKLQLNSDCHEYFVNNVLAQNPGPQGPSIAAHERLRAAQKYFLEYLSRKSSQLNSGFAEWLMEMYEKVTQRLKVSHYTVGDSAEVGVIFEVMNNRGRPLSELEKVKNYLLYLSSKLTVSSSSFAEQVNDTWAGIFRKLMGVGLGTTADEDRLLRCHWLMVYDYDRKQWDGSKSVKRRFNLKDYDGKHKALLAELVKYVKSLCDSLTAYCDAVRPNVGDAFGIFADPDRKALRKAGDKLRRIKVTAPFLPLLIACRLRFAEDPTKYLNLLKVCELYAFRVYRIAERRSNAGEAKLFQLGNELYADKTKFKQTLADMLSLIQHYCPDKTFRDFFDPEQERDWYYWTGLKYFLYEYEESLAGSKPVKVSWDALDHSEKTIEHILPQTPDHKYWKEQFGAAERKTCMHDLGNLCLTEDNSVYQNKPFPVKKGQPGEGRCYANSNLFMERELATFSDWTPNAVAKRRKGLVDWYRTRWAMDST